MSFLHLVSFCVDHKFPQLTLGYLMQDPQTPTFEGWILKEFPSCSIKPSNHCYQFRLYLELYGLRPRYFGRALYPNCFERHASSLPHERCHGICWDIWFWCVT